MMRPPRALVPALALSATALSATALLAAPRAARAQTYYTGGDFRRTVVNDDTLLRRHRFEFGLDLAGTLTSTAAAASDGTSGAQRTIYLAPGVFAGFMVLDRLEVRLAVSYLGLFTSDDGTQTQNSNNALVAAQGLYHVPLRGEFALYGGLGVEGYYGRSSRPLPAMPSVSVVDSDVGGGGQLLAGLLMQPGPRLMMRVGLRFDALFGSESPTDRSLGLPSRSATNLLALIDYSISFR